MTFKINLSGVSELECFHEASREELRVLLALLSLDGAIVSEEDLARVAGVSAARCRSTLVLWEESGVITRTAGDTVIDEFAEKRSSDERYEKPATDVAKNVRNTEMAEFLAECARLMDRPALNREEIKDLEYILTDLGVSKEYLLILVAHLCDRKKVVTPRIVLKEVEQLLKKNITTVEELELYINKLEKTTAEEWEFRRKFEIYRPLSDTELSYLKKWMGDFGYDIEIIFAAYGAATKTVSSSVPFSRMDRILSDWHEAGCKTVSECLSKGEDHRMAKREKEKTEADKARTNAETPATKRPRANESSAKFNNFDTEDALMAALKRSYGDPEDGEGN